MTKYTPTMTATEEAFWRQRLSRDGLFAAQRYEDREMTCGECGMTFTWTRTQQQSFAAHTRTRGKPDRPVMCSKTCSNRRNLRLMRERRATA